MKSIFGLNRVAWWSPSNVSVNTAVAIFGVETTMFVETSELRQQNTWFKPVSQACRSFNSSTYLSNKLSTLHETQMEAYIFPKKFLII
jgi:hypothetical protein